MNARVVCRILPVMAIAIGACTFGEWSREAATSPLGLEASFRIGDETYSGELLAADADGILVLAGYTPGSAEWAEIEGFTLTNLGAISFPRGGSPSEEDLERIRLASRYPWGLTDEEYREVARRSGWGDVRELGG